MKILSLYKNMYRMNALKLYFVYNSEPVITQLIV